jgi:transcriptional regulator with XRE-family HTH domain
MKNDLYKSVFAARIREARKRTGFTQLEVTAETGIDDSRLSKYENGKLEPTLEVLGTLAEFYGVTSDWLIGIGSQKGSKPNYERNIQSEANRAKNIGVLNYGNVQSQSNQTVYN